MKKVDIVKVLKIIKSKMKSYTLPLIESISAIEKGAFFTLVSTILSARTNDKTTDEVCKTLFKKVRSIRDLEKISIKELELIIKPINFYKTKAKHLKELPNVLKEEFNSKIPKSVEELVKLPGVGRKTANLVSAIAFGLDAIGVDTHVHLVMNRLGYVKTKKPEETEKELRAKVPKHYWKTINLLLVPFGQNICTPISPFCTTCFIRKYCNRVGVKSSR